MPDLAIIQQTLGVTFHDLPLLEQALVHSSYLNENPGTALASNERLEFLGDAILGMIVAQTLYEEFPHLTEGQMTRLRASLVRQDTLAQVASSIGLGEYLYMGKGEEAGGGRKRTVNLAGAFEALVAAIYLDGGLEASRSFILRMLDAQFKKTALQGTTADYKSELQELLQSRGQPTPTYHLIEVSGPEHTRTFTVEVRCGDRTLGRGSGKNKKAAESEAARSALASL